METTPPDGQPAAPPQQVYQAPPSMSPPPQGQGHLLGYVLITLALLLVGGGVIWALTKSPGPVETPTPTPTSSSAAATPATNAGGQQTVAPTPTPTPTPVPTTAGGNVYQGQWNGRFTSANTNCPSGNIRFTVASNGTMTGTATTDFGVAYSGGGNVDSNGNISAGWTFGSTTLNLNGRLLASNTGSGTYSTNTSCSGTFSVTR